MMTREQASRIEKRTLKASIFAVLLIVVGSLGYGFHFESGTVILDGIFSVLSLIKRDRQYFS